MLATRRASSARLQRESGTASWRGRLQARAVTWTRTSGGKTPGRARARGIGEGVGFDPAPPPFTDHAVAGSHRLGKLLITPVGMVMRQYHNLGTHDQPLTSGMCPNQPTQTRGVIFG
jgi:hypothetical protein